eukprot:XP_001707351.1 Hypothetical protein GL50803_34401 [Giardia lamblia ATCC 50803]
MERQLADGLHTLLEKVWGYYIELICITVLVGEVAQSVCYLILRQLHLRLKLTGLFFFHGFCYIINCARDASRTTSSFWWLAALCNGLRALSLVVGLRLC